MSDSRGPNSKGRGPRKPGQGNAHDDWFREQVQHGIREADTGASRTSHDQVRADWLARRASIMRGLAESRAGLGEIKKSKDDDFFENLRRELREKK